MSDKECVSIFFASSDEDEIINCSYLKQSSGNCVNIDEKGLIFESQFDLPLVELCLEVENR